VNNTLSYFAQFTQESTAFKPTSLGLTQCDLSSISVTVECQ